MALPRANASSTTGLMASGSRCWLSAEEPTTSRKRMVTQDRALGFERCDGGLELSLLGRHG